MKALRNVFLALAALGLVLTLAAAGGLFYLYRHPDSVKGVVEGVLSRRLDAAVTIASLTVDLQPLRIEAGGISIRSDPTADGVSGEVAHVRADVTLSGPFGSRRLVVETLALSGWRLRLPYDPAVLESMAGAGEPSLLVRLAGRLADLLLFREVRLGNVQAADGEMVLFANDATAALAVQGAVLTEEGTARVSGSVRFDMPSKGMTATLGSIDIRSIGGLWTGSALPGARVTVADGSLKGIPGDLTGLSLQARFFWDTDGGRLMIDTAEMKAERLKMSTEAVSADAFGTVALNLNGRVDLRRHTVDLPGWRLQAADWLDIRGSLHYGGDGGKVLKVGVTDCRALTEKLMPLAARVTGRDPGALSLEGPLGFGGVLEGRRADDVGWQWRLDGRAALEGNRLTRVLPETSLRCRVAGGISVSGEIPALRVSAEFKLDEGELVFAGRRIAPFTVEVAGAGAHPDFRIERIEARLPRLPGGFLPFEEDLQDLRLAVRGGRVNAETLAFEFPQGLFSTARFGPLEFSLSGDLYTQRLSLEGSETRLLNLLSTAARLPADWQIQGQDRLQATANLKDGRVQFDARLKLERVGFEEPRGEILGEGIDATASAGGSFDPDSRQLTLSADVRLTGGEALYRRFYADFEQQPLDLSAKVAADLVHQRWRLTDLRLGLEGVAQLQAGGELRFQTGGPRADLELVLPATDIGPLYKFAVLDPFAVGAPFLERLSVGGMLSARLAVEADAEIRQVTGRVSWSDGSFSIAETNFTVDGATLDFPVWYQAGPAPAGGPALAGRLTIDDLVLPVLGRQSIDWPLRAGPGYLDIEAPMRLDVAGGTLAAGPVHVENVYTPERLIKSRISITSVDTGRFLSPFWPEAALGPADGTLAVTYGDGRLIGSGRVSADAFGGQVTVRNPSVASLFSPAPVLACDVALEGIRLSDLTGGTGFGRIEGVLQGTVENLEIVDGQPQRFELLLGTVRREGVPQRISVKAINSISQIGSGQNPFAGLAGSAMKLLPGFGYRKIGIRASLHNDIFRINGTIREDGTEYLVRRDGLVGVDVINRDPDNRIRFKDMVQRIGRALAPENEPVIDVLQR